MPCRGLRIRRACSPWGKTRRTESVVPHGRYEAEGGARLGHVAQRRERQVGGDQLLTRRGQLLEKPQPNPGGLLRIVFETVLPGGVLEAWLEHRVPSKGQRLAAGLDAHDAVARRVPAGAANQNSGRHLVLGLERAQLTAVHLEEAGCRRPQYLR